MKKLCLLILITCMLAGSVFAVEVLQSADVSCRTDSNNADLNRSDHSKLSIEVDDTEGAKSWIKFDLSDLADPNSIRGAVLRLALHEDESGDNSFDVSAVNDDYTTNIDWAEGDITWNNAPANDTASYSGVLAGAATLMGTINLSDALAGDQFFVDVSSAVLNDTDGIVQFILHNSTALIQVATHDHSGGAEYWPTLIIQYPPLGADYPMPEVGDTVTSSLATLSWTNPDPNEGGSIFCDVYLGTEPNRLSMDMVSLGADVESVVINTTNFPNYGNLIGDPLTTYYWYVDCWDGGVLIPGEEWYFDVYDNEAPYNVNAGADQVTWMTNDPNTVDLVGTAEDDGLPSDPGALTISWTETVGPGTSVIASSGSLSTSVSFVEPGDYTFTLTADDGELQTTDTVRVVVGADACDASHIFTGDPYNDADANQDCLVDIQDFIDLIVDDWLECTDTLTNCPL